ncbi:N-acetylmuramoyl-L-alanine amidase [Sphingomonas sp.]|jgi:N-acetylmuramoyl-L-alanine amidase|uniref:N-acetylmuramoyl-L-alanine amidase n=1 Tax=Sphingomonas sp. TaxID=28214 RepID=UPI002E36EFA7|nr:N-acetylmuramoyl-L-alanine amidase [Sphingomonas sp.]HEX4695575.1 N-acetylmuramoyl-L-alanine amidase [Sphingomonas sp.]
MVFRWTGRKPARHYVRVSFILSLLALWFGGAPAWAGTIQRVEVKSDSVVVTFDRRVADASSFLLTAPQRVAVDVTGASPGGSVETGGLVNAVREGEHDGGARIVFDLARPAVIASGRFGDGGRVLTLQLKTVDDSDFARAAAEGRMRILPPFNMPDTGTAARYQVALPVPASSKALVLPRVEGDPDRPLVVIDAGHGGFDPGAISPTSGLKEKDVTLKIAKAIRDELLKSGRVRVALTRDDDRFLVLQERYGIARKLHADLFISIHCDSVGSGDASGASVYTLSEVASDKEAAKLAARENKADIIAGVDLGSENADVSSILIDLTQRETMNASAAFARLLGREAAPLVPLKSNFHRMASLMVLKAPDMPSILFETGYISNPNDAAFLDSAEGRQRIAESIERAVEINFAKRFAAN